MSFKFQGARELLTTETTNPLVEELKKAIDDAQNPLSSIQFSGKSIGIDAARILAPALALLPPQTLAIDFSDIISGRPEEEALQSLRVLSEPFQSRKKMVEINLSDNALGLKGINACFDILSGQEELERIFLNNNGIDEEGAKRLAEILLCQPTTKYTKLHMVNNLLRDGGAAALAKVLAASPQMEDIKFSANRFGEKGGLALVSGLVEGSSRLTSLELSDNSFGGKAVPILSDIIKKQKSLRHLSLADASLGAEGVITVIEALMETLPPLESLDISGNDIDEETSETVAELIGHLPSLRRLVVSNNELEDGAKNVAKAIVSHGAIESVDFSSNCISNETVKAVRKMIGKKTKVNLEDNDEDEDEEETEEDDDVAGITESISTVKI
ncbi:hypothetical protein PROFUN_07999 [Planoprotostelium fungivorum]|uniref:Uncharacterized protein n=1 Tax=Planoprotostelium fungivorum TaxID=1890364 RepID=A0A2P6MVC0_9EUKA|nr:hypothetical protein PROFUN_07999 [Planoprotostelium fungivorum]